MENKTYNEFLRTFHILSYDHNKWEVWKDLIFMISASISNTLDKKNYDYREKEYLRIINKYIPKEQMLFPKLFAKIVMSLEENPDQDLLGSIFMELNLSNGDKGQFFTPYSVCKLMAKSTMYDISERIKEKGYISINDCACGAGATLIAGINEAKDILSKENKNFQNHVFVVAQDIDETVALMCYIQLSLLGVAAVVKVGDSLANPITELTDDKNNWYTPIYYSDIWQRRRLLKMLKGDKNGL